LGGRSRDDETEAPVRASGVTATSKLVAGDAAVAAGADAVEQVAGDAGGDDLAGAQLVLLAHGEQRLAVTVGDLEDERLAGGSATFSEPSASSLARPSRTRSV
jgi:hypothetical protein